MTIAPSRTTAPRAASVVTALNAPEAGVGLVQHGAGKTFGPLVIAALQLVALAMLKRSTAGAPLP